MKIIYLLLPIIFACNVEEVYQVQEIKCVHDITYNQDLQRIEFEINSTLPQVEICITHAGETYCKKVQQHYYKCNSITATGLVLVEIFAETDCRQFVDCR